MVEIRTNFQGSFHSSTHKYIWPIHILKESNLESAHMFSLHRLDFLLLWPLS